jgi:peptide/nickel transport system substrate-binding protein
MRLGLSALCALLVSGLAAAPATAQKSGGVLKMYFQDNPPSASIHEEATTSTVVPFMGIYNNLVLFDPQIPQNSLDTIRPDLAESWSWSADGKQLTFKLVANAKWHDGKPVTSADVKCTWDMLTGRSEKQRLRKNPRASWYWNLDKVTTNGEHEVTFHLNQPQPSFLVLLASGFSPVYSCHVPTAQMRTKPVGTGPFKLAEFKQKEGIKLVRNPDYFKKGKPYLDGIEISIVPARGTAILGFVSGRYDMTAPFAVTIPLLKDVKAQASEAVCEVAAMNNNTNLIVNRDAPPFDNPDIRRALLLTLDRKAFIDIITEGQGKIGGIMLAGPEGLWGMPPDVVAALPGYSPDVEKSRAQARAIMEGLGYGPNKLLKVKVATRNIPLYRDPAVILIDQLRKIHVEGELDVIDTSVWFSKVARGEYSVGLNLTAAALDDPDVSLYENYACGSERNYTKYCNPEVEKLIDLQSRETDREKRRRLVWEVERKLAEDVARPIIAQNVAGLCWQPHVKGFVLHHNSLYNNWRFDDVWLDR